MRARALKRKMLIVTGVGMFLFTVLLVVTTCGMIVVRKKADARVPGQVDLFPAPVPSPTAAIEG